MLILVLNGPNLNLLGQREPGVYGTQTLGEIESMLRRNAARHVRLDFYQSNHEGALIDAIQQAPRKYQGVVFNPGGYAHASVAIRDAISAIPIPVIEVHLSNIHGREEFRARSITAGACVGIISGLGALGYQAAIEALERVASRGEGRGEGRREERRPEERRPDDRREERRPEERRPEERRDDKGEDRGEARDEESSEELDARSAEAKRRRRGRRGGRGRRRIGEEPLGGAGAEARDESDAGEENRERVPVDIEAKYANLKGATVRRGLDVLAESGDADEERQPMGKVTFADVSADEVPPEDLMVVRQGTVAATDNDPDAPIRRIRVTGSRRVETPASSPAARGSASASDSKPSKSGNRAAAGAPDEAKSEDKAATDETGEAVEGTTTKKASAGRGRKPAPQRGGGGGGRKPSPRKRVAKKAEGAE